MGASFTLIGGIITQKNWGYWDKPKIEKQVKPFDAEEQIEKRISKLEEQFKNKLNQQFPLAHKLFAISDNNAFIGKGPIPDSLSIKWETGKVINRTKDYITFIMPDIKYKTNGGINFNNCTVNMPNKIGSIINLFETSNIKFDIEIISINNEEVIIALGVYNKV